MGCTEAEALALLQPASAPTKMSSAADSMRLKYFPSKKTAQPSSMATRHLQIASPVASR